MRLPPVARPTDTDQVSEDAAVWLVIALLLPTGCGAAWVLGRRLVERLAERRHLPITAPPIERVAADLRRLRAQLAAAEDDPHLPGKALRCRAIRAAYLDALTTACGQLEVPPPAGDPVPPTEIYRVEAQLRQVGLDVRSSG
jgi:hypothetical protein